MGIPSPRMWEPIWKSHFISCGSPSPPIFSLTWLCSINFNVGCHSMWEPVTAVPFAPMWEPVWDLMWEPICSHLPSHLALLDWLHPMWEPIMGVPSDPIWEAVMEVPSAAMRPREPVSSHMGTNLLSLLDWLHPVTTLFHPMMALFDVLSIQVCFVSPHPMSACNTEIC